MIHAYIFIVGGPTAQLDRDGHGPEFQAIMNQINSKAGTSISVTTTTLLQRL